MVKSLSGFDSIPDELSSHAAQLAEKAPKVYVTPEDYGAKGDNATDDTAAIQAALTSGNPVMFDKQYYMASSFILQNLSNIYIKFTENARITAPSSTTAIQLIQFWGCSYITIDGPAVYSTANQNRANGWNGQSSNVTAFHFTNSSVASCSRIKIKNAYGENLDTLIKVDSASQPNSMVDITKVETKNTCIPIYASDTNTIFIEDGYLACNPGGDKLDHAIYINSNTNDVIIDNITCLQGVGQYISISNSNAKTMPNRVRLNNIKAYDVIWGIADLYGTNIDVSNVEGFTTTGTAQQVFYIESSDTITFTNVKVTGTYLYLLAFPANISVIFQDCTFSGNIDTLFNGSGNLTATFKNNTFNRIVKTDSTELVYRPTGQDADILLFEKNTFLFDSNWNTNTDVISIRNNSQSHFLNNTFINYGATPISEVAYLNPSTGVNVVFADNKFKGFNLFVYEGGAFGTIYGNTKIGALQKNTGVSIGVSTTSYAVTGLSEVDTAYTPNVALGWNSNWWITSKSTSGFTINFGTAPASASTLDWSIKR